MEETSLQMMLPNSILEVSNHLVDGKLFDYQRVTVRTHLEHMVHRN